MLLHRFYDETLAQASYLIGSPETGEAVIVDPNRAVDEYLEVARIERMKIASVTETHIHADFVSGARELAARTGASLLLSDEGGADWRYAFATDAGATLLHDGDRFDVGSVRFDVRHTPGHTPEHICFLVTDTATSDRPMGMLTGDFIFVGDVGRPDLLERAGKIAGTMEALARDLFKSLRATSELPEYLQLWPGHGAGSACGKSLGAVPSTTLGFERLANWAFQIGDEDAFVRAVLSDQPEPPRYFARMKVVNRDGPPPAPALHASAIDLPALDRMVANGAVMLDTRPTREFIAEHVPGAINIPAGPSFTNWAGSLLSYDRDIILLTADPASTRSAIRALMLIGLDRVIGWAGPELRGAWRAVGRPLERTPQVSIDDIDDGRGGQIIDVRALTEWEAGHIPGARHFFLGDLSELARDLPRDAPLVLHCEEGSRSAIGASVLRADGFTNVSNMSGGFAAWTKAGRRVEKD
jgi:hydroxyacylglutathione hydrolase